MAQPTQTFASNHDTTGDQVIPPGSAQDGAHLRPQDTAERQVQRLGRYLADRFPQHLARTNVQEPETAVDMAIRLLDGLTAVSGSVVTHCGQEYCNKPAGHTDEHGWINAG